MDGALIIRDGVRFEGLLYLNGTTVDAPESWPTPATLALNRFRYEALLT